jgi:hypothetical protein
MALGYLRLSDRAKVSDAIELRPDEVRPLHTARFWLVRSGASIPTPRRSDADCVGAPELPSCGDAESVPENFAEKRYPCVSIGSEKQR